MNKLKKQNMLHVIVNVNLMAKQVIQIKSGIWIFINGSIKETKYDVFKKYFAQNCSYDCEINYAYIKCPAKDSVITCDKIINVLAKLYDDTSETVEINSNHKIPTYKMGYYALHTILLVNILLLEILII